MRKPDFLLVGAPKCGTTAMFSYLVQHPDIFAPDDSNTLESAIGGKQEIHYFDKDLAFSQRPTLEEYLGYFSAAKPHQVVGDSSVFYLYSKKAAAEIKALCPNAKIIVMLRNPIDMMHSWHSQLVFWGDENIRDFKEAINAETERKKMMKRPDKADHPIECFFYKEIAQFSKQLRVYFEIFDKEQIKVVIFDDFKSNTLQVYQELLHFLGCQDSGFKPKFEIVNPNKTIRNYKLQQIIKNPPVRLRSLSKTLFPQQMRSRIRFMLQTFNSPKRARKPLDPSLRSILSEEFADEIQDLSGLLGRDLRFWLEH
ncbi:sulfotransferase [Acaryochloris sp. IP29b_bin.137]|uniref:sulfotransferase family protein n=1 Tax=Acaryochloris sp. IP29b_bin.137 TaxID=2969217 RepID=UPI00261F4642|nr:sulfotransferase [Acaryochloris sp. IP29b_bin.137]